MQYEVIHHCKNGKDLKIPVSTASYYRDRHSEFLPHTGSGRKKKYKPEALEALKLIVEMANKNTSTEDIEESLSKAGSRNIEVQQDNNNSLTTVQQQPISQVKLINLLDKIADQKKEIQTLREEFKELREYIKTPLLKRIFRGS